MFTKDDRSLSIDFFPAPEVAHVIDNARGPRSEAEKSSSSRVQTVNMRITLAYSEKPDLNFKRETKKGEANASPTID